MVLHRFLLEAPAGPIPAGVSIRPAIAKKLLASAAHMLVCSEAVSKRLRGGLNLGKSVESKRSPIFGAFDVDPRDPGRA